MCTAFGTIKAGHLVPLALLFITCAVGTAQPFSVEPINTPFTGSWARNIISVWGDFDGDGDLDLVTHGRDTGQRMSTLLFTNAGNGALQALTNIAYDLSWDTILANDFDHDNVPDLLFSGFATGTSQGMWANLRDGRIALGASGLTSEPTQVGLTRWWGYQTGGGGGWVDMNNDGAADATLWGNTVTNAQTYVHRTVTFQLAPGDRFLDPPTVLINFTPSSVASADFNRDGRMDMVTTMRDQLGFRHIYLHFNSGTGMLGQVEFGMPGATGHSSVGDFDQDGWPDVLLLASVPRLFWNTRTNQFVEITNTLPQGGWSTATWGDLDNDGTPDVLMTSGGSTVAFRNLGGGQFAEIPFTFPTVFGANVALGDADGDGDLDFVLNDGDHFNSAQYLCRNNAIHSNTPPTAPTSLSVTREPTGVVLHWNAATDAETASQALTYNVRVGTTPGGSEVVSALADNITGRRKIVGPGNAGNTLFMPLNYLPSGATYWSVQAVDASLAGGAFATEQVYQTNPPVVSGLSNLTIAPNLEAGPFNFNVADAETSPENLVFAVHSFNTKLISPSNVVISVTDTNASMGLTPNRHQSGTAEVIVTVTDQQGEWVGFRFFVIVPEAFSLVQTNLPPLNRGSVVWGDADGDGDLDLLTSGFAGLPWFAGSGRSDLWRNDAGVIATNPFDSFGDGGAGAVNFVDVNRDGNLDISVCGGTNYTRWFYQTAPGTFSAAPAGTFSGVTRAAMAWGDRDGDGDPEAIVSGNISSGLTSDSRTWFYDNLHPGGFTGFTLLLSGLRDGTAEWVDVDNDGDNDLFLTGSTTWNPSGAQTRLYLNNNGVLSSVVTGLPNVSDSAAVFADFNLDGYPDLALFGNGFGTGLFFNNGNGQFTLVQSNLPAYAFGGMAAGDFDSDGYPDLLISGIGPQDNHTELWFNDHGVLRLSGNSFSGFAARGVAWGDLDGDGDLDLALVGSPDDGYSPPRIPYFAGIYRNELNAPGSPTPSPVTLAANVVGSDVMLTWQMPPGAPHGLSYNVRVGSTPFAVNIMSAPADPITGRLKTAQRGNAGWSRTWRLRNLPNGTYFWSVQAVSPAYQGSTFAMDAAFTIPSGPVVTPLITAITPVGNNQFGLNASGQVNRYVFVEVSTNLQSWESAALLQFDAQGKLAWTNNLVAGARFFRLRHP